MWSQSGHGDHRQSSERHHRQRGKPYVNMSNSTLGMIVTPVQGYALVRCMNPPTIPAMITPLNASEAACSSTLMYQKGIDTAEHSVGSVSAVNTLTTTTSDCYAITNVNGTTASHDGGRGGEEAVSCTQISRSCA